MLTNILTLYSKYKFFTRQKVITYRDRLLTSPLVRNYSRVLRDDRQPALRHERNLWSRRIKSAALCHSTWYDEVSAWITPSLTLASTSTDKICHKVAQNSQIMHCFPPLQTLRSKWIVTDPWKVPTAISRVISRQWQLKLMAILLNGLSHCLWDKLPPKIL